MVRDSKLFRTALADSSVAADSLTVAAHAIIEHLTCTDDDRSLIDFCLLIQAPITNDKRSMSDTVMHARVRTVVAKTIRVAPRWNCSKL